ncbi:MAG: phosphoglycerate dehydrogenase [Pseudomonadota bacterium]
MTIHLSRPKSEIKFLLLEKISETADDVLRAGGYTNIERIDQGLNEDALAEAIQGVHLIGIRSRSQLTEKVIKAADKLVGVGCFSVGTNQVNLEAARTVGVPVFNAPFANTRSVAELTIAEIVMLFRRTFAQSTAAHNGGWQKSAVGSNEVRDKTLGIVGYGNIGSQLAVLAEAMGMHVVYYDVIDKLSYGTVSVASTLDALLAQSDVVTLHVPETAATRNLMNAERIAAMKPGAFLINNARGTAVDIDALAAALRSGHLRGAAIDVFPTEPKSNDDPFESPLQGLENVILTPHVGGSTQEAQLRIGDEVARRFVEYADTGTTLGAVNFPQAQLPLAPGTMRFIQTHRNVPGQLKRVTRVFETAQRNISGMLNQSDGDLGYAIIDVDHPADNPIPDPHAILEEIRGLSGTIKARLLNRV